MSLLPPAVWSIFKLVSGTEGPEILFIGLIFIGALAATALPILAVYVLRRYWNRDIQIRLRWVVVAVVVLGLVASGAAVAGDGGFLAGEDSDYPDSDADPDYSDSPVSAYDDGEYGPMVAPGNISVKESARGEVLTCDETAGSVPDSARETDIIRGYEPTAVHNDSGRISVAPYEITIDGETQELNGHYHIRLENGTTFSRESIIEVGTYDGEAAETSFDSVTRSGDGGVVMEQVDAMSVYYDVIHEDGEVHRYTTWLCRS